MRLIVHFGTFKTGTTSIQETLFRHRAAFLAQGVLYPAVPLGPAHHALFALFANPMPARIPRQLGLDPAAMRDKGRRAWEQVKRDVAHHRPEKVVLSSELFLLDPTLDGFRRLRVLLEEIATDITPCAYVRAPAPYYLSYLQQNARMSGAVSPPRPLMIREAVELVEAAFGRRMEVRAYDPAGFAGGDVVRDFVEGIVGATLPGGAARGRRFNETLSAEAMSISVSSRRVNCPGDDHRPVRAHQRLLDLMGAMERGVGGVPKPRLKPEVAAAVTRASADLVWLRDTRGIVFAGVDYAAIDGRMPAAIAALREIDLICEVEPARRDWLMLRVLEKGVKAQIDLARLERLLPVGPLLAARQALQGVATRLRRSG
jgi:hypothetical protein